MNQVLIASFQQQKGIRGAHFYDGEYCEFVPWHHIVESCNLMRDRENPAHLEFEEKLLHTISNIDAKIEYVLVRQHHANITIECFREQGL